MPHGDRNSQDNQNEALIEGSSSSSCGLGILCSKLGSLFMLPSSVHKLAKAGDLKGLDSQIKSCTSEKEVRRLVNELDPIGNPPLYYCVRMGHYLCAQLLLRNGANSKFVKTNVVTTTLLHLAAKNTTMDLAGLLLAYGAEQSLSIKDDSGKVPFQGCRYKLAEAKTIADGLKDRIAPHAESMTNNSLLMSPSASA
jgi:ankyrin repeat protein